MHLFPVRVLLLWLLIAIVETVHGTLRALFLVPKIGTLAANQFGVVFGSLLIVGIALLFSGWLRAKTLRQQFGAGISWVVLMLAFEVGLGRLLARSWDQILADYDPRQGGLMIVGMFVLLVAPWLAATLSRPPVKGGNIAPQTRPINRE